MANFKTMSYACFLIIGLLVHRALTGVPQVTTQENAQTTQATITQSAQTSSKTQSTAANAGAQSTAANTGSQSTAANAGAQSTASSSSTQTAATSSSTQAATTPSAAQTTGTSTETTAASADTQTTAAAERASVPCPDGQYNDITDTVTFILDERECQITVYLSKPPKGKKIQKAKKAKKEKVPKKAKKEKNPKGKSAEQVEPIEQGERLIEKSVSIGPIPGRDVDMCADVEVSKYSKDVYSIQAGNCVMYVKKPKKGKNGSSVPMIRTETNPPV